MTDCNECRHQRHSAFGTWCEVDHGGYVYGPSIHGCADFSEAALSGVLVKCVVESEDCVPTRAHEHDAACDLRAAEAFDLHPGERRKVGTGLRIELPDGYYGDVTGRSGLTSQGIMVGRGIIDAGYRGEVMVTIMNGSSRYATFERGDRIAQLLVQRVVPCTFAVVDELGDSERGTDGFGSTGL